MTEKIILDKGFFEAFPNLEDVKEAKVTRKTIFASGGIRDEFKACKDGLAAQGRTDVQALRNLKRKIIRKRFN